MMMFSSYQATASCQISINVEGHTQQIAAHQRITAPADHRTSGSPHQRITIH
jgi:hypothetical protein